MCVCDSVAQAQVTGNSEVSRGIRGVQYSKI